MTRKTLDPALRDAISRSHKAYESESKHGLKTGKPNAVADFVTYPRGILKDFVDKYARNNEINDDILAVLPQQYKKSLKGYQLHHNQLSLLIDNAANATQLRFVKTELLNKLRKNGLWEISSIEIRVTP